MATTTADRFVHAVARAGAIPKDDAMGVTTTVLETFGELLDERTVRELSAELPPELGAALATVFTIDEFGLDEFVRRVAASEGVDEGTARRHIEAVFQALTQAIGAERLAEIIARLSVDYEALLPPGRSDQRAAYGRFVRRVYSRGPFPDEEAARRAIDGVLETLGERIAHGEVEDLRALLPFKLHAPLLRGDLATNGKPEQMELLEFLERVNDRLGVGLELSEDYARAVLTTLRETVGDDEFADIVRELQDEYLTALAAR
jgi:uncharacterized protein (DUF2267 family)